MYNLLYYLQYTLTTDHLLITIVIKTLDYKLAMKYLISTYTHTHIFN